MTVKGLTTPYRVGCEVLICLCRCEGLTRGLLLDWYLGSQKLREIPTLPCCITLSSFREYNASSISGKKNFLRRLREGWRKSHLPSTYHKPLSFALHFCLSFSSPPLHPCRFICPSFCRVFVVCLLLTMAQNNTKLCDFSNTNNNDFISTMIAPITDAESCEINAALLNLVMKD